MGRKPGQKLYHVIWFRSTRLRRAYDNPINPQTTSMMVYKIINGYLHYIDDSGRRESEHRTWESRLEHFERDYEFVYELATREEAAAYCRAHTIEHVCASNILQEPD